MNLNDNIEIEIKLNVNVRDLAQFLTHDIESSSPEDGPYETEKSSLNEISELIAELSSDALFDHARMTYDDDELFKRVITAISEQYTPSDG